MAKRKATAKTRAGGGFDLHVFLASAGIARKIAKYSKSSVVFAQGDPAHAVFYIQKGSVKLSVLSRTGKEAVVGILEMLHTQPALADRFLSHMLARNIRVEEDLVDQLFNSSEKRLARTLLMLARYGKDDPQLQLPKLSQETLAEMIGTTRSRVNFFMNKFRDLGFIDYNGDIKVHSSLLTVVLHD
jgi:CRP-like cAMP-binding protein